MIFLSIRSLRHHLVRLQSDIPFYPFLRPSCQRMSTENTSNEKIETAEPTQKVTLGANYFADPSRVVKLPPFHGRSAWDVMIINTLQRYDSAMAAFAARRKHHMSISNAARKSLSAVPAPSREEKDARERKHFSALMVSAVNKFWACVQSHLDATKEVELKDQRKKELHEKQISSLEYTEKLLKKRVTFHLGEGDLPPLRLLEHIGTGLRSYQRIGVEWLMSLHDQGICGILADEMGLGKTVQTIAFFTFLAEHREDWGTHLIVVPMSILLNWENEFRRWAPAFNVLVYYGSVKERAEKRKGWDSNVHYNAVIVSYNTLLKDKRIFRRRKWHYLVLDEAHAIKSWETQRWQVLLDFRTEHRLLLSGTPLQNNPMELWSLLHFLMPESIVFDSHEDFKALYGNPVVSLDIVHRLHQTLRPFVLRRLKCDVEKQLPKKVEKILLCPLSKRQRALYDEYMALEETRKVLASKDTLSILGVLIALRKVCNHPDLFQERPTESPFVFQKSIATRYAESLPGCLWLTKQKSIIADWNSSGSLRHDQSALESLRRGLSGVIPVGKFSPPSIDSSFPESVAKYARQLKEDEERSSIQRIENVNRRHRRAVRDVLSWSFLPLVSVKHQRETPLSHRLDCLQTQDRMTPRCTTMKCLALDTKIDSNGGFRQDNFLDKTVRHEITDFHLSRCVAHPHRRMLQYDSGKLQALAQLLPKLRHEGHRCLIFTQFTKVLNILEKFLTANALTYFRLDGSTHVRKRQHYVDAFNRTDRIFAFILSTRSGGLGLNLVGADTVIFYDSDWNPAIDVQAQDRCHRIGQTRNVTIYRLVSEFTVEEKILLRAREKKRMNNIIMRAGGFETLSVDRSASEPDARWKDSVLDFFHDLDEDFNGGHGSTSRLEQLEGCLQKVEDDEDALVVECSKMDDTEREETIVQFGIGLKRAISRFADDSVGTLQTKTTADEPLASSHESP